MFGRLGTGKESDELFPVQVKFDFPGEPERGRLNIVGIAAGAYHSVALAGSFAMYSAHRCFVLFRYLRSLLIIFALLPFTC